jgi:hypothetical protein
MLASSTVFGVACGDAEEETTAAEEEANNPNNPNNPDDCDPDINIECEEIEDDHSQSDYGDFGWEEPETSYRFVMLEDESTDNLDGATPGADIDAIGLDVNGDTLVDHWATTVEDFNIGGANNEHADFVQVLGEPDADCMAQNFTSLGGAGDNGDNYIIVSFSTSEYIRFDSEAIIVVWELGPTNCPEQTDWKDDETTVSISISSDRASFIRIGTVGTGTNAVIIP